MSPISENDQHHKLQQAVVSSLYSLMALQFVSRLFTFVLNQALFRLASPQVFGTAAIQFELIFNTVIFLSREGVRHAVLRAPSPPKDKGIYPKNHQALALSNLTTLPFILGLPSATLATYLYGRFASAETRNQPLFKEAVFIYAVAAIVELASEPLHNQAMHKLQTKIRIKAEGSGIMIKPIVVILVLLYDSNIRKRDGHLALVAFALGQLTYAITLLAVYLSHYKRISLWPTRIASSWKGQSSSYFDVHILRLSITITVQSIFKQILTEGDKLILTWLSPLRDQGGYALAVNYGSLIARVVFQPIEEVLRLYYSRILSDSVKEEASQQHDRRQKPDSPLRQATTALTSLFAVQLSFAVIFLVFGPSYLPILLHFVLPPRYHSTSGPQVLRAWLWYIPILAVNGGLEAFFASVASPRDLRNQSRWMAVFSIIYIFAALMFYRWGLGDPSLVYANMINLTARIVYCSYFIKSYFGSRGASHLLSWKHAIPRPGVLFISLLSKLVIWSSERRLNVATSVGYDRGNVLLHILLGGVLGLLCVGVWWSSSGRFVLRALHGIQ